MNRDNIKTGWKAEPANVFNLLTTYIQFLHLHRCI